MLSNHHYPPISNSQNNYNFIGDDSLLNNIYVGVQTVATLNNAHEDLIDLTTMLRKDGKRVLVLTNITKLGKLSLEARLYAVDIIKDIDFDKVAIFGNHTLAEKMVNFIIMASGRGYKMQYFSSKEDAKFWLTY